MNKLKMNKLRTLARIAFEVSKDLRPLKDLKRFIERNVDTGEPASLTLDDVASFDLTKLEVDHKRGEYTAEVNGKVYETSFIVYFDDGTLMVESYGVEPTEPDDPLLIEFLEIALAEKLSDESYDIYWASEYESRSYQSIFTYDRKED